MRTVEEIKADIASCDSSWIDSALCRSLRCELYETILDGIPLDRLEAICAAEKDGRLLTLDENYGLALLAGGYAISENKQYFGATFVRNPRTEHPQKISYHDAAKLLLAEAEKALGKEQGHDE